MPETYEYAGFVYEVKRDDSGKVKDMLPIKGQHSAASKAKHRQAAIECYKQDKK